MEKIEPPFEKASHLIELAEKIELLEDREELKESIEKFLEFFEEEMNVELSHDVTHIYGEMSREHLIARVERIKHTVACLVGHEPIEVGKGDSHYANSVTSDPEGLRIAMAEGEAPGPIRLLVGLDLNALIGFTSDHLNVSEIEDSNFDLRDTGMRKAYCRHISGEILPEDIKYVVLRIPRAMFPESMLEEVEQKNTSKFIFRGAKLPVGVVMTEELDKAA